jgi:hypothetical protein
MAILYILWSFWYIFYSFGVLYQEKSGDPGLDGTDILADRFQESLTKTATGNKRNIRSPAGRVTR